MSFFILNIFQGHYPIVILWMLTLHSTKSFGPWSTVHFLGIFHSNWMHNQKDQCSYCAFLTKPFSDFCQKTRITNLCSNWHILNYSKEKMTKKMKSSWEIEVLTFCFHYTVTALKRKVDYILYVVLGNYMHGSQRNQPETS